MTPGKKRDDSDTPRPNLMRNKPSREAEKPKVDENVKVSAGPVDRVVDAIVNPTREKIRELTSVDRIQGRLFPQLDMLNLMRKYCLSVAAFREDPEGWQQDHQGFDSPLSPDAVDELIYRTAQWQKSIGGSAVKSLTDIALAEVETRAQEQEEPLSGNFDD